MEVEGELEYEIEEIVDSRLDRRRKCPLLYNVKWAGYEGTAQQYDWIPANELENASEAISDFHSRYPDKPGPLSALQNRLSSSSPPPPPKRHTRNTRTKRPSRQTRSTTTQ